MVGVCWGVVSCFILLFRGIEWERVGICVVSVGDEVVSIFF